ncbi:MAG: FimV/HubP family polar landmark protein [Wenzhouxiangella sp.]|jgi:pilus assembly protein FimV|nr:FimV/HubP family polar landmark protein [Wenzhouxiangella sp.]
MRIVNTTKRITVTLLAGFFLTQSALASLGLGEARVQSFLGQNLDVDITLMHSGEASLESLEVAVASLEDHARLGIPTDALALELDVVIDRRVTPPIVRLRSARAVESPFVQVLVDARWASGRILREYTLFIDPPTVPVAPPIRRQADSMDAAPESEVARPVEPAPAAQSSPPRPERPAERAPDEPTEVVEPDPGPVESSAEVSGPLVVENGDTLWSIASNWRPDSSLSMHQAMLAIFDANPAAFMDDNINRLRRGARLIMPAAADARAIPAGEATRRFLEQTRAWESGQAAPAVVAAEPIGQPEPVDEPTPEPAEEAASAESEGQEAASDGAEAEPGDESNVEPVEQELPAAAAEDAMDVDASQPRLELTPPDEDVMTEMSALAYEREELSERLSVLESEIARDGLATPEIDNLVDQTRQAIDSADVGGMMVASEDLARLEEQLREARQAREMETAPEIAEPAVAPSTAAAVEPAAADSSPSMAERWLGPVLGGVGLLLLMVALLVLRRRRAAVAEDQAVAESDPPETKGIVEPEPAAPVQDQAAAASSEVDDAEAALMGILGRDEDEEDDQRDRGLDSTRDRTSLATEGFVPQAADDDAPDLAELSNRLESDSSKSEASAPSRPETLDLDDEDYESLFASDEDNGADAESVPEDGEPLTLDFEMPEEGPEQEAEELGQILEEDRAEASGETPGELSTAEPTKGTSELTDLEGQDESSEAVADFDFGEEINEEPVATNLEESGDFSEEPSPFSLEDAESPAQQNLQESDVAASDSEEKEWFALGDDEPANSEIVEADGFAEEVPEDVNEDMPAGAVAALSDEDAEVKLDLARAYISMEDADSARSLLEEVINDGSSSHQEQAKKLLDSLR